jgi:LEA14-like dessication related protein
MPGMNKTRSMPFPAAGLCLAATVLCVLNLGGCIKPPEVSLSDIKISSMSFKQLDLVCMFDVENPNLFAANLKTFDCDFRAFDRSIASGSAPGPIPSIPAGGRRMLPINLTISLPELAGVAQKYAKGKTVPYALTSKPVFNILGASLPVSFNHGGKIPSMLAPKWKLKGASVRGGPEPALLVTFEITNPSGIHMSLAGVKGALNLGGSTLVEIQETKVTQLPGDEAIELIVPVRVRLAALAGISRKLMIDWRSIKFDGEFKMKTPLSLRKMMLNKPLKKKP